MLLALCLAALAVWIVTAALPWQPHRTREQLTAADVPVDLRDVEALIPARNEDGLIAATLCGLARQGPGLLVRVIDDESSDATAARVRETATALAQADDPAVFPIRVELLAGRPLPAGWGGKVWALEQGLAGVTRRYVLLLDADIVLAPLMIPALLAMAARRRAALVSIMAKLRCESRWEKLLVPPFIFFFKLLYPFALAAEPRSRVAAAAGGCILVEAQALRRVAAFASIRSELIDDCALARRLKRAGFGLWIGLSSGVRSERRYATLADFWRMVSRTAFTQLRYSPALLGLTSVLLVWLFVVPPAAVLAAAAWQTQLAAGLGWVAMAGVFSPTVRHHGLAAPWALSLPVAATLLLAMTWGSAFDYWRGTRARWKARTYHAI